MESAASNTTARQRNSPLSNLTEIAIPIYNEEKVLARSVRRLREYLDRNFPYPYLITIADNGSTDRSWEIATRLADELPDVRAVRVPVKGRGGAVRHVWGRSTATVVAYMDVDLSIDLDAFAPLVAAVMSGHSDIAIGTRYAQASYVDRSVTRAFFSRSLNFLLRHGMGARFSDAMCGFKAARREAAQELLPYVEDHKWFFDPELLFQAQRRGLRIHEIPVVCLDDPDSTVHVIRDARDDLLAMARVLPRLVGGLTSPWFTSLWLLCTVLYAVLAAALQGVMPAVAGNAAALGLAAAANTAGLAVSSLGVRGAATVIRYQLLTWIDFLLRLVVSTVVVVAVQGLRPEASPTAELVAGFVAVASASVASYRLLRGRDSHPYTVRELLRHEPGRQAAAYRDGGVAAGSIERAVNCHGNRGDVGDESRV